MDHVAKVGRVRARVKMIEFQHDRIALPARYTGVLAQELLGKRAIRIAL